jgi:hypothetical protein
MDKMEVIKVPTSNTVRIKGFNIHVSIRMVHADTFPLLVIPSSLYHYWYATDFSCQHFLEGVPRGHFTEVKGKE